jgi:antitoxin component YwqK of YwqJK toxin-antitoxin module
MKTQLLSAFVLLFALVSCTREDKVTEEKYADGSAKRICVYRGKGENREMIRETTYYENKQTQMEGTYKNNQRDGKWTYWHMNGKVWAEGTYVRGKAEGKRTTYFDNGKVQYEGN